MARLVWIGVVVSSVACGPRVVEQDTTADGDGTAGSHTDPGPPGSSSGPTQSDSGGDADASGSESSSTGGPEVCLGSCECTPSGTLLWERVHPIDALERVEGWDLALDADENLIVVGIHVQYTAEDQDFGVQSMWLALLDAEAAPIWSVTSVPSPGGSPAVIDGGFGVHVDPDGRILVVGSADYTPGWSTGALRIHGPDGELLEEIFDAPESGSTWWAVTTDDAGNAIVVGTDHTDGSGGSRAMVRSYAPGGEVLLDRFFVGDAGDTLRNDAVGVAFRDGTIFVAGTLSNTHDYGEEDIWLTALETSGEMLWEDLYDSRTELVEYSDLGWDAGHGLALAPDGGVLVFGDHRVNKDTGSASISTNERWARRYGLGGEEQWTWWRDDPVPVRGTARDATHDACGNAIIVGNDEVDGSDTMFVAKLDPAGELLWEQHGHPAPWTFGGLAVAAHSDGSIVTLGNEADGVLVISRYAP